MVVHTCRSIWFIDWVVWIKIQNGLNCFWKWVWKWLWSERKENLKIKEFRKLWNLFLESLPTICSFLLNWKVCLKPHLNLTWVMFETWTENGKMEKHSSSPFWPSDQPTHSRFSLPLLPPAHLLPSLSPFSTTGPIRVAHFSFSRSWPVPVLYGPLPARPCFPALAHLPRPAPHARPSFTPTFLGSGSRCWSPRAKG